MAYYGLVTQVLGQGDTVTSYTDFYMNLNPTNLKLLLYLEAQGDLVSRSQVGLQLR